jgi:hypothetical protein
MGKVIKTKAIWELLEDLKKELTNELIQEIEREFHTRVEKIRKSQANIKGKWQDVLIRRKVLISLVNENREKIRLIQDIGILVELMKLQVQKGVTT